MVDEKRKRIQKVLPRLNQIYETIPTNEAAFIYRGIEGYKNYRRDLERVAEDTYFLGAKALWMSPQIDSSVHLGYINAMKKKKAKHYTIFDPLVLEKMPEAIEKVGGEYRVLPKDYAAPGVVDMFGDYIVTFTSVDIGNFGEDGMIFVMRNKELAESYKTWFRFIWDFCPKEK